MIHICYLFFALFFLLISGIFDQKMLRHYLHVNNLFASSIIIIMAAALPWTSLLIYSVIRNEMSDSKHDTKSNNEHRLL